MLPVACWSKYRSQVFPLPGNEAKAIIGRDSARGIKCKGWHQLRFALLELTPPPVSSMACFLLADTAPFWFCGNILVKLKTKHMLILRVREGELEQYVNK